MHRVHNRQSNINMVYYMGIVSYRVRSHSVKHNFDYFHYANKSVAGGGQDMLLFVSVLLQLNIHYLEALQFLSLHPLLLCHCSTCVVLLIVYCSSENMSHTTRQFCRTFVTVMMKWSEFAAVSLDNISLNCKTSRFHLCLL